MSSDAEARPDIDERNVYRSRYRGLFHRVVCDEGHRVKNPATNANRSVYLVGAPHIWILSATPMINKPSDLIGYLHLLFDEAWRDPAPVNLGDAVEYYTAMDYSAPVEERLYQLDPVLFGKLTVHGKMGTWAAFQAIPKILSLLQIRRSMASVLTVIRNGAPEEVRIGDQIPHYNITTVELENSRAEQAEVSHFHAGLISRLKRFGRKVGQNLATVLDPSSEEGRMNVKAYRRLCHLAYSPSLEVFARSTGSKNLVEHVTKWHEHGDYGLTFFITRSKRDYAMNVPRTRAEAALYIARSSAKLRYLAKLLLSKVIAEKRRILIFAEWPMVSWHCEMFLQALQFNVLSLRSAHSEDEKTRIITKFNDPAAKVDILITTYRCCSVGVNLHAACHDVVMLQPAINANTVLQAIGRVHRLGQTHVQDIHILFSDHTFDRFVEMRQATKMIAQIEGQGRSAFPELASINAQEDSDTERDIKVSDKVHDVASSLYQQMLGQRRSRLGWTDPAKLYDPGEENRTRSNRRVPRHAAAPIPSSPQHPRGKSPPTTPDNRDPAPSQYGSTSSLKPSICNLQPLTSLAA